VPAVGRCWRSAALTAACFVKAFRRAFLGRPRSVVGGTAAEVDRYSLVRMFICRALLAGPEFCRGLVIDALRPISSRSSVARCRSMRNEPWFRSRHARDRSHTTIACECCSSAISPHRPSSFIIAFLLRYAGSRPGAAAFLSYTLGANIRAELRSAYSPRFRYACVPSRDMFFFGKRDAGPRRYQAGALLRIDSRSDLGGNV